MGRRSALPPASSVICSLTLAFFIATPGVPVRAAALAQVTPTGDAIELEYTSKDGPKAKTRIPLYTKGEIRYFSAGVGVEEREAKYPPFPLKLIFVAGPRGAYVTRVAVTVADAKDAAQVQVPSEQVSGPWLFLDLPPGIYRITATRENEALVNERVTVSAGKTTTVYFRWSER